MAEFPTARLLQADASLAEVAQLRSEFAASDLAVQAGIDDFFRGRPSGEIRAWLVARRAEGYFSAPDEGDEAPVATQTAPDGPQTPALLGVAGPPDEADEGEDGPDSGAGRDSGSETEPED